MTIKLKVAFDIDGVCNSEYSTIFSKLTNALKNSGVIEIFIISAREKNLTKETEAELHKLNIVYDHLIIDDDKKKVIKENRIDLFIDNEIEQFRKVDNSVCCLLVREQMNYDWDTDRFLGSKKTIKII
jgi:uncharacterized HAD superfamily protein